MFSHFDHSAIDLASDFSAEGRIASRRTSYDLLDCVTPGRSVLTE
jgi:hypothetical protein